MRSTVRGRLGIATEEGPEGMPSGLAIHFRAPLWELAGDHRHCIYFLTGEPQGRSLIPAGKPDRWIHGMHWNGPPRDVDSLGEEELKRWVREAAGDPAIAIELERVMPVTTGIGLAERFRDGDAFLVGDAAHRVTPRGATGMNTAIRDGYDLGWKLAWVLRGWAGERLLDTYERERRPVAEYNTQRSSPSGRLDPRHELRPQRRHRRPHPPRLGRARRRLRLDAGPARRGADAARRT